MNNFKNRIDRMISGILNEEIEKKVEKFTKQINEGEWKEIEVEEGLKGNQKKLDVAEPKGKLTAADFEKLRSKKKETKEFYFHDEDESIEDAEEKSQDEPTYVGRGLKDNKIGAEIKNKIFGSFTDTGDWYDEQDREHTGEFDFDYDEEEFEDFEPFYEKFGKKTSWFAPGEEGKKFFNMYKDRFGPMIVRVAKGLEEEAETEEGNAFTDMLRKTKKGEKFKLGGKTYTDNSNLDESEKKWIQKTDMKKGALHKKLGVPEGDKIPVAKLKSLKVELSKKAKGDKKLSASDAKLLKQVNLALTLKNIKESAHEVEEGAFSDLKDKISAWAYDTDLDTIKKCKEATKGKGIAKFQDCLEKHGVRMAVSGTRQGDSAMGGNWKDFGGSVKSKKKSGLDEGVMSDLKDKISAWAYDTDLDTIKKCKEATKGKGIAKFQDCLEEHGVRMAVSGTRQGDAAMGGNWNDWKGSVKKKKKTNESTNKLSLTEDELIDVIERLVYEQIAKDKSEKDNISKKSPEGLKKTVKAQDESKKENEDYAKSVVKKMKEYVKAGSVGEFNESPENFPQSNYTLGKMKEKTEKYHPSAAVEEYIESFAYPGLENTKYDEIKPNEEWLENNLKGSSKTGNNPEWANAVKTDVGEKVNNKRKKNAYQKEKERSYNRVTQPVDETGKGEGESSLDNMFTKLESTNKKGEKINEDIEKMKNLITYNRKTQ